MERIYCTITELESELKQSEGVEDLDASFRRIRGVSEWIDAKLGMFIPYTETRRYDGFGKINLWIDPLLSVSSITDDGDTLSDTDYLLYPRRPKWENGPYTRIAIDPDASGIGVWTNERDVVAITGRWGLYEKTADVGTDLNDASFTDSKTALAVDNGAKISPGMVLLIDTEQMLVNDEGAYSDSTATLGEDLDTSEEIITVSNGTLINVGEIIKVDFEKMKVIDISGNDLLVIRGYRNTTKATHTNTTAVNVLRTFTVERGVNGTSAAAHNDDSDISRYLPPYLVSYLCRKTVVLWERAAQTAHAGKTANVDLGEVFYHADFPQKAVDEIEKRYRLV